MIQPQPLIARRERQRDVLADGALHQQRLGTVRGDVDDARPDRVGGVAEGDRLAVERACARRPARSRAGQDVEQLVLALSLERHDAQDLAGVEIEAWRPAAAAVAEALWR